MAEKKIENKRPQRFNSLPMSTYMEVKGNHEVVLEGCRGVLEYDTDVGGFGGRPGGFGKETGVVRVRAGRMTLRFTGRCLVIRCLTADSLVVEGFITGIEFLS